MNEENKNPNDISIVKGNGIEISEVKDNLTFEEHKEKPNKNNIVIPVTQEHVDINQTPDLQTSKTEDNQNQDDNSDDYTVSDATSSGAQQQEQNTDTDEDDFDNILNNQENN